MSIQATLMESTPDAIRHAGDLLRQGKLVAFPTETVYGLGADALNDRAVASIYTAKGRPQFNPLIIHFTSLADVEKHVIMNDVGRALARQFWPGPLTLVLPRRKESTVSLLASAGLDTLAVRVPSHLVAQALLKECAIPLAAPSANTSGKLSPTTPMHVVESLGRKVDFVLAGGKSRIGLESTVLDLTSERPRLLRPGGITCEQIEKLIGPIDAFTQAIDEKNPMSPGMLASHYAPNIRLRMNAESVEAEEAFLMFGPSLVASRTAMSLNLSETGDLEEASANLFAMLHKLDQPHFLGIAVMPIPDVGLGIAINDRLRRASI